MNNKNDLSQLREKIRLLERKLGVLEDVQMSCCGITMAQCHALVEIGRAKRLSLNELADKLNLDNSSMSRTVNNLVNKGFVQRDIDPQDRRYVTITQTEVGRNAYESIETGMEDYFLKIYELIPAERREQVLESLDLLLNAIDKSKCCD